MQMGGEGRAATNSAGKVVGPVDDIAVLPYLASLDRKMCAAVTNKVDPGVSECWNTGRLTTV